MITPLRRYLMTPQVKKTVGKKRANRLATKMKVVIKSKKTVGAKRAKRMTTKLKVVVKGKDEQYKASLQAKAKRKGKASHLQKKSLTMQEWTSSMRFWITKPCKMRVNAYLKNLPFAEVG